MVPQSAVDPGLAAPRRRRPSRRAFAACRGPRAPIRFPHEFHLTQVGGDGARRATCLNCTSCHAPSATSEVPMRSRAPSSASAAIMTNAPSWWPSCPGSPRPRQGESPSITTPTSRSTGCGGSVPCHAGVVSRDRAPLPAMFECFSCHAQQCGSAPSAGLATNAPTSRGPCPSRSCSTTRHSCATTGRVSPSMDRGRSQTCHSQADCQSCHDLTQALGVEKRRPERIESRQVHRGDFWCGIRSRRAWSRRAV